MAKQVIGGIYKIKSEIHPDRFYIGSSVHINERFNQHINRLKKETHHSKKLQYHVDKYGINDLSLEIIEEIIEIDKNGLLLLEQKYLNETSPWFNISRDATSRLGVKTSDETKLKLSEKRKGRKNSEETRRKISESNIGRKFSNESILKLSKSLVGNKNAVGCIRSDEFKKIVSERNLRLGLIPPSRLGKKWTEEQKFRNKQKREELKK